MKKTLMLSLLTAGVINSANAVELYNNDQGLSYELNGDLQVQLRKDFEKDSDLNVEFDDLELENRINYQLSDSMSAFGQLSFDFADAANHKNDGGSDLSDAYLGMKYNSVSISIGMQDYATDDFGVEEAYEMNADSSGFDKQGSDGDDVIRIDLEQEYFTLSLSTDLESEGAESEGGKSYDVLASTSFNGFELVAAYQSKAEEIGADMVDTYGVSIAYDAGFATFAADYSEIEDDDTIYNLATTFKASKTVKVRLGYVATEPQSDDDTGEWYGNITYKFPEHKNVRLFAEIADTDAEGLELSYLAGMRVKF